jgi:hypothetical protein
MLKTVFAACAVLCAFTIAADARPRQRAGLHPECNITMPCAAPSESTAEQRRVARGRYIARELGIGAAIERREKHTSQQKRTFRVNSQHPVAYGARPPDIAYTTGKVAAAIVAHPQGCPSRAFCGCGAAVRVFGAPLRHLWLAANWFRFPRTAPAPGTVAVRRHHVFVLEAHLGGNVWKVYDANSGRRQTRIHARSIAGYVIVNPHGAG